MTKPAYRTVPPGCAWREASRLNIHIDEAGGVVVLEMEVRDESGTLGELVACGLDREAAAVVIRCIREKARELG